MSESNPEKKEGYLVIARKYRPQTFHNIVGQEHIVRTLKNAITQNRVHHFYLFTGSRGIGKTSTARVLAKALNCKEGPTAEPCGKCPVCLQISEGKGSEILALYEIDGASNRGVDDIRELRKTIRQKVGVRYRVIIIDEVHMLTSEAFNALLKTLEEPPEHVKFIFATTEVHKVPETIISRCQRLDFRRISETEIADQLKIICEKENIQAEYPALKLLAKIAEGGMRDSQSKLDQAVAFTDGKITVLAIENIFGIISRSNLMQLIEAFKNSNFIEALNFAERAYSEGVDVAQLIKDLINIFREIMIIQTAGSDTKLLDLQDDDRKNLAELAKLFTLDNIMYATEILTEALKRLRMTEFPRLTIEIAFVKLCKIGELVPLERILSYLEAGAIKAGQKIQTEKFSQNSVANNNFKQNETVKMSSNTEIETDNSNLENSTKAKQDNDKAVTSKNINDKIRTEEIIETPSQFSPKITEPQEVILKTDEKNAQEHTVTEVLSEKKEVQPKSRAKKADKAIIKQPPEEQAEITEDSGEKGEKKSSKKKTKNETFSNIKNDKTNGYNNASAFLKMLKIISAQNNNWNNAQTVIPWLEHNLMSIKMNENEVIITLGADTFEKEIKEGAGSEIIATAAINMFKTNKIDKIQILINKEHGLRDKLRNNELIKEIQKKFSAQIISIKEKKLWQSETLEADSEE